jgi:hypothetical protein
MAAGGTHVKPAAAADGYDAEPYLSLIRRRRCLPLRATAMT